MFVPGWSFELPLTVDIFNQIALGKGTTNLIDPLCEIAKLVPGEVTMHFAHSCKPRWI